MEKPYEAWYNKIKTSEVFNMNCPSCGRKTDILANYCSNCGVDLNSFYGLKKDEKHIGDYLPVDIICAVVLGIAIPAAVLVIAKKSTGLNGGAAFTSGLSKIGPGGMTGGLITLAVIAAAAFLLVMAAAYFICAKKAEKSHKSGSARNITMARIRRYPVSKVARRRLIEKIRKV